MAKQHTHANEGEPLTPKEQLKQWVDTWASASEALDAVHRKELRNLDGEKAISLLLGHFDYTKEPFAPKPFSGLIEQQRIFMKILGRD